ncbi:MAG: hypothetical protein CMK23_05680 [Porticoccaceae bacterium]|nr:hypothetical protein [Porticoccaceae bacterium]
MSKYEIIKDKPVHKHTSSKRHELSETLERMKDGDCILLSRDKKELRGEAQHISRFFKDNESLGYVIRKVNETDSYCWVISKEDDRFYKNKKRITNARQRINDKRV